MMKNQCILALDQGTSGTAGTVYDQLGHQVAAFRSNVGSIYPSAGWVEQDPNELLQSIRIVAGSLLSTIKARGWQAVCAGLANQGECLLLWDILTGDCVYPLIGWQCMRSADYCRDLKNRGYEPHFRELTGLPLEPEWPATKIPWVLQNVPRAAELLRQGRLAFSQSDSWFMYHLTKEHSFATDHSTASRSGLYNLGECAWSEELMELFQAQGLVMPTIRDSGGDFGTMVIEGVEIPWRGNILDQSIALLGQSCLSEGQAKVTLGTCAGMWMNLGTQVGKPKSFDRSVAWSFEDKKIFAIAGESIHAGSLLVWLSDSLHLPWSVNEFSDVAFSSHEDHGVVIIPALSGLGAPYWNDQVRGTIYGITGRTNQADLLRAGLEAIGFSVCALVKALESLEGRVLQGCLKVDGGLSRNKFLLQFLADILQRPIQLPEDDEGTLLGTAVLTGSASGIYQGLDMITQIWREEAKIEPRMPADVARRHFSRWEDLIQASVKGYGGQT